MFTSRDYDPAQSGESDVYGMNFVNDIDADDSIVSATWTLSVAYGTDATPSARLINAAWVESPTVTNQRIANLVAGVTYIVQVSVNTTLGNTKQLYSHIECVVPT